MTPKSLIEPARHAGTALLRSQSDARLVDLTRDGNERAFEAIVQRYHRPLLRYCSRILPAARAEDAVQHAFLRAHRAIHAGDAELNLRPWLYRIAHNASLNLLRQTGFDHEEMSEEIDGVETPPQAFERGERLRNVVAAVRDLPERQRNAIVLQAMEGRSYEEIAQELGVTDGAVRQLLNRARNTLREAAAALTPTGLLTRVATSGGETSVAERIAQVVAGGGGSALLAKAGAALVVTGAVAGGAVTGTLPVPLVGHDDAPKAAAATGRPDAAGPAAGGAAAATDGTATGRGGARPHTGSAKGGGGSASGGGNRRSGSRPPDGGGTAGNSGPGGGGSSSGDSSGSGSSGSGDSGNSGPGGDSSGSGSSGSGDGANSGPGGGGDSSGSGSSGSGSDSSGSGSSGSGSSDSLSSGSGSSGSGSSGSDSSGSDSSGSGSGDDNSGPG